MTEDRARPQAGEVEERSATAAIEAEDKMIRGLVPYEVEADLGDFTETIAPGALADTDFSQLHAVIDHADRGLPLARYPGTLSLDHQDDGLHWAFTPPKSRPDLIEAVQRGDVTGSSWRMRVAEDRWNGDHRTITRIGELHDITIAGSQQAAYPTAIEYRTTTSENNDGASAAREEGTMPPQNEDGAAENRSVENENENEEERIEEHTTAPPGRLRERIRERTGSLQVEERVSAPRRGLAEEFRAAGFPGEVAEIPWEAYEERAVTWTPSINLLDQTDRQGGSLGFDQRYAWTALPRVGVDSGVTSVQVLAQSARSLATAANVIRGIAATTDKAETGTTINLTTVQLSGVASVESGIPNVVLEQEQVNTLIEGDLRLAVNEGLDKLVNDTFAASGFQAPGSDNPLVSYRKAMTTLYAAGYNPDTLVLTPAAAEAIDVMVSGISGGTADFVFTPGAFGPDRIFNLRRVISKVVAAPVVLDSTAYGRLYASAARLAVFEENSGKSNTSLVRLELHAACGVERQTAAVRIAAS